MIKITEGYASSLTGSDQVGKKEKKERSARSKESQEAPKAPGADAVDISGRGMLIGLARKLALAAPEVRQALIDELVGKLERGEYDIEGSDVAPKMIREHLMDWME